MSRALYETLLRAGVSAQIVANLKRDGLTLPEIERRFQNRQPSVLPSAPFLTPACPDYPEKLHQLYDQPLQLFHRGRPMNELAPLIVGVVGSRKATSYGLSSSRRLGAALARNGVTVCSGLARGIDGAVHRGVIDELKRYPEAARPVAVLGHGWDYVHPRENHNLFRQIAEWGTLLTEYPPDHPPSRWTFPARNRIIAALSDVLVVVEAGARSGSLHTAGFAGDLGRDVWAVPSSPGRPNSAGVLKLLGSGANMLTDFDEFVHQVTQKHRRPSRPKLPELDDDSRDLLLRLARSEGDIEPICRELDWSATEIAYRLTELELAGLISRNIQGQWDLLCWELIPQLR
jgi:DNA processing protein